MIFHLRICKMDDEHHMSTYPELFLFIAKPYSNCAMDKHIPHFVILSNYI